RGLAALCAVARFHQCQADPSALAHRQALPSGGACTRDDLLRAAKSLGLKARWSRFDGATLHEIPLPAVVCLQAQAGGEGVDAPERRVVLVRRQGERWLIQDFDAPRAEAPGPADARPALAQGMQAL